MAVQQDFRGDIVGSTCSFLAQLHLLYFGQVISQSKINDLDILNTLPLPEVRRGALEYLIGLLFLEHDHHILRLKISMDDVQFMQKNDSLHNIADYKCTFELVQELSLAYILEQILPVDILGDDVLVGFGVQGVDVLYHLVVVDYLHDLGLVAYCFASLFVQL